MGHRPTSFLGRGVARSREFERIRALPRRDWLAEADEAFVDAATEALRRPGGSMRLRPMQAQALCETFDVRGLFLGAGVGTGKTLVSLLLPVVLKAERPLLLVPKSLKAKTLAEIPRDYAPHWQLHDSLTIETYDALSRAATCDLLDRLRPDLIIADEAHRIARRQAARTRRIRRYLDEHPDVVFVPMSGTLSRRSIMDYWELLWLALGDGCPLPRGWGEVQDWAGALDEHPQAVVRPGALLDFCRDIPKGSFRGSVSNERSNGSFQRSVSSDRFKCREGYQRRLRETRGVIITSKTSCPSSLVIDRLDVAVPPGVGEALRRLEDAWETPGGEQCTEILDLWRHARELSCGFYYRWAWPGGVPDVEWLEARKAWRVFVRDTLRRGGRRGLDSELQVANAVRRGELAAGPLSAWEAIRDRVRPKAEAVWLDDFLVRDVAARAARAGARALVWVEHRAMAEALEARGTKTVVSVHRDREGKNLQAWSDNIVVSAPASGAAWDQLLGRTHREGQEADEVTCGVYLHTKALRAGFLNALADAQYLQDTLGQSQKLLYATRTFAL